MSRGSWSSRCCRRGSGRVQVDASAFLTGRRCRGSCSCSIPGSPGGTCRRSSGLVRASPVGGGLMSGSEPVFGRSCMPCCLSGCAPPGRSGGGGRSSIPATCRRKRGAPRQARARRPRTARLEASLDRRSGRSPTRVRAHRWEPPRRHAAAPARRGDPGRTWQHRPPTLPTRRADRRLRLRLQEPPAPASPARDQAGHRPPRHRGRLRPGPHRRVVERTFAWLHQFKRLLVRYDRRADIHEAFLALGCCLICWRQLAPAGNEATV